MTVELGAKSNITISLTKYVDIVDIVTIVWGRLSQKHVNIVSEITKYQNEYKVRSESNFISCCVMQPVK